MKINKYELLKNDDYNIYLDNGEVITISGKVITDNELLLKKDIDKGLYDKLHIDNTINNLYKAAIKYINIRLRSIKEIKDYLLKKESNIEIVDRVISKLIHDKYLDDDTFTKAFIKDKLRFTKMGDYKIRKELERLGVNSLIIEENIVCIDSSLLEDKIKKIIDKEIKVNKKYQGINLRNKIYNHLLSQGYSSQIVQKVINTYNF